MFTARLVTAFLFIFPSALMAADYTITLKENAFTPNELVIPANEKVKVTVKNEDSTPIEFESHDLKREKIIQGKSQAVVSIGPLKSGTYNYFDEFHDGTTGTITAK
jgi:hypothetical protein